MARGCGPKDIAALKRQAERQGWTVTLRRAGHLKWLPPDRERPAVFTPSTPSDTRSLANMRSQLRKSGLVL